MLTCPTVQSFLYFSPLCVLLSLQRKNTLLCSQETIFDKHFLFIYNEIINFNAISFQLGNIIGGLYWDF